MGLESDAVAGSQTEDIINVVFDHIMCQRICAKGIPQVVVMTKGDEACPLMELCSAKVGVPLTNIFPLKNYHDEIDKENDIDVLILKALGQIVQVAEDRLEDKLDKPWRNFSWGITCRVLVNAAEGNSHTFECLLYEDFFKTLKGFPIRSGGKNCPSSSRTSWAWNLMQWLGHKRHHQPCVWTLVKDGYKFNQEQALSYNDQHYTCDPNLSNQSFCLVYVIDANTVQFTDERLLDKLKIICQRISDKGIPQVAVMTKVDEACPLVKNDLRKIYKSKKIKEKNWINRGGIFPGGIQNEALKEKLKNFPLSHPDVKDIKILVAGQIGAGKSSFINSVDSAFQGRITCRALVNAAESYSHSFTQRLKGFPIRCGGKTLPFVFKDIMGLETEALAGSQTEDIINAVFGHFNQEQALSYKDQHYTCDPNLSDQSFWLVYVIDANTVQFTDDRLIDKLKIICQRISDKGIPQVIVMTKVDEACPLFAHVDLVLSNSHVQWICAVLKWVCRCHIFPVKNYHDEIETNDDIDILILKALE
ncbi:Interferon-induced protein 44-like [Labeo rohita]|uniref:Interferon-induced protein 44-like n=1 Tax=Labeo rohita TaxID=84645 RepID=A0ABQ8N3S4_LABRO|nr:Interferon-induced protein 44-like [Labeo rohita]